MQTWRSLSSFRIAVRLDHTASWCRRNGPSICFSTTSTIPLRYPAILPMRARSSPTSRSSASTLVSIRDRPRTPFNDRLRWHRMTDLHVVILIRPGTCPRRVGAAFAAVLVALLAFAFPALAAVIKIDRISVTVSDLARTEKFYRDALGFETVRRRRQDDPSFAHLMGVEGASFETLTMRLGAQEVEFIKFQKHGRQYPPDSHSQDLWFQHFAIVVSDMDKAFSRLQQVRFTPISVGGPQTSALPRRRGCGSHHQHPSDSRCVHCGPPSTQAHA